MPSAAKNSPPGSALPSVAASTPSWICSSPVWLGEDRNRIGVSILGIALVQVPLCSFDALVTVFVWAITSAGFSLWMKCPLALL
jgi:hypothetical protein